MKHLRMERILIGLFIITLLAGLIGSKPQSTALAQETGTWFFSSAGVGQIFDLGSTYDGGTFTSLNDECGRNQMTTYEITGYVFGGYSICNGRTPKGGSSVISFDRQIRVTEILFWDNDPEGDEITGWKVAGVSGPFTGDYVGKVIDVDITTNEVAISGGDDGSGGVDFKYEEVEHEPEDANLEIVAYIDINGDGERQATETEGLPNVSFQAEINEVSSEPTTGSDGTVLIEDLKEGWQYNVAAPDVENYLITTDDEASGTLKAGENTLQFGYKPDFPVSDDASILIYAWKDDGDGIPETGESGIPNLTIEYVVNKVNGELVTNNNGNATLVDLKAGWEYMLKSPDLPGYNHSTSANQYGILVAGTNIVLFGYEPDDGQVDKLVHATEEIWLENGSTIEFAYTGHVIGRKVRAELMVQGEVVHTVEFTAVGSEGLTTYQGKTYKTVNVYIGLNTLEPGKWRFMLLNASGSCPNVRTTIKASWRADN